jgi:hypothetical protein
MADRKRGALGPPLGSAVFFALAPGVVAGIVPGVLAGWRSGSPPQQRNETGKQPLELVRRMLVGAIDNSRPPCYILPSFYGRLRGDAK